MDQIAAIQVQQRDAPQRHESCRHVIRAATQQAQLPDHHRQHDHLHRAHRAALRAAVAMEQPAAQRQRRRDRHQCTLVDMQRALVHELDHRPGQADQAGAGQQSAQSGHGAGQVRRAGLRERLRGAIQHRRAQRVDEVGDTPGGDAAYAARHPRHVEEKSQQHRRQRAVTDQQVVEIGGHEAGWALVAWITSCSIPTTQNVADSGYSGIADGAGRRSGRWRDATGPFAVPGTGPFRDASRPGCGPCAWPRTGHRPRAASVRRRARPRCRRWRCRG